MGILLYVGMSLMLLSVMSGIYINNKNTFEKEKIIFDKKHLEDKNLKIEESLSTYYNNNYAEIHGNYFASNLIKGLSNTFNKNEGTFYLFNNEKFCTYNNDTKKFTEESIDTTNLTLDEIKKIETLKKQKEEYNKDINCVDFKNESDINSLLSLSGDDSISTNQLKIIKDLRNLVGNEYFIRIDIESIKTFKYLNIPILNLYVYNSNKRYKPNLNTEIRINTDLIVNNKINESKILLDNIANVIVETGKRKFKGYSKLKTYKNFNSFSNLAEGYMITNEDESVTYGLVSDFSLHGFQTGNLMAFSTRFMNENSESIINNVVDKLENENNHFECGFTNSIFKQDLSAQWFSNNAYYMCKIFKLESLDVKNKLYKPEGYCSLKDNCALNYTFNDENKIIDIDVFTLNEYLLSEKGFNFDISKFKNPFYPNESIINDDYFILSSSNSNAALSNGIGINLGLKTINRPFLNEDSNSSVLFDNMVYENNFIINKYYINY